MAPIPPSTIRVLIVDDEPPARRRLADLLKQDEDIDDVLEAGNGIDAVEMIRTHNPDIVFLDIQMPEMNGFGVVNAVGPANMPIAIFVTAYDQHAIRAFEAEALDYLVKPYSDKRFGQSLERAKNRLAASSRNAYGPFLPRGGDDAAGPAGIWDRLVVKSGGLTRFVLTAEVDWIEAAGVYVNLHVKGKEILYRASLRELSGRLDPLRFVRIHRSSIVNIESILQLEPTSHGEFEVVLKDGTRLNLSRNFRRELETRLGQSL